MKRLLILNGSHSDIPLIRAGKQLGYRVLTTGNDRSLIGHAFADEYHPADFSDREAVLQLAGKLKIDAICSCANDFGALSAAWTAEQLGLPGHDSWQTSLTLHHKDRYREFAQQHGVPSPRAVCFSDIDQAISLPPSLPVIVKPVDLTGGKGVTRVDQLGDYENAVQHAFKLSRTRRIVVEEFLEGHLHSLTTFLREQRVIFCFSDNEYSYQNPFLVTTSAGPATDFASAGPLLIAEAEKIATLLKLKDGVFHIQYIMNSGRPSIIEITRRCSGDLYPGPVERATGVPWAEWIVRAACGLSTTEFPVAVQRGFVGRHCIMAPANGVVRSVTIASEIRDCIYDQLMWWKAGDRIDNFLTQKLGILQLEYQSREQMLELTSRINQLVRVELE